MFATLQTIITCCADAFPAVSNDVIMIHDIIMMTDPLQSRSSFTSASPSPRTFVSRREHYRE